MGGLNGMHLLILIAVILLLFGAARLPALAKSVGQSARVFKGEMRGLKEDDSVARADAPAPDAAPAEAQRPHSPSVQSSPPEPDSTRT